MKELILKEQHLNELNAFLQEIPVKYGLPILNFLGKVAGESTEAPTQEATVAEEAK